MTVKKNAEIHDELFEKQNKQRNSKNEVQSSRKMLAV